MIRLLIRLALVIALSYGSLTLQRHTSLEAQNNDCTTCPDTCYEELSGDFCSDDTGNNCSWDGATDYCRFSSGCSSNADSIYDGSCCYQAHSPIIIDITGDGFLLTSAKQGVWFAITNSATKYETAWTQGSARNAWLVLDRNGNGLIDDGTELFGNFTQQPTPPPGEYRNGFAALAMFDTPENGGNGDGVIDERDSVYSHLQLWQDANHNGISEPKELADLPSQGVQGIDLHYSLSKRMDQYGNQFRFRSVIFREPNHPDGRFAWDVYLDFVSH